MGDKPVGMLLFEVHAQDKNGRWIDVGRYINDDETNDLKYIGCPEEVQEGNSFDDEFSILNRQLVLTPVIKTDSNGQRREMPLESVLS